MSFEFNPRAALPDLAAFKAEGFGFTTTSDAFPKLRELQRIEEVIERANAALPKERQITLSPREISTVLSQAAAGIGANCRVSSRIGLPTSGQLSAALDLAAEGEIIYADMLMSQAPIAVIMNFERGLPIFSIGSLEQFSHVVAIDAIHFLQTVTAQLPRGEFSVSRLSVPALRWAHIPTSSFGLPIDRQSETSTLEHPLDLEIKSVVSDRVHCNDIILLSRLFRTGERLCTRGGNQWSLFDHRGSVARRFLQRELPQLIEPAQEQLDIQCQDEVPLAGSVRRLLAGLELVKRLYLDSESGLEMNPVEEQRFFDDVQWILMTTPCIDRVQSQMRDLMLRHTPPKNLPAASDVSVTRFSGKLTRYRDATSYVQIRSWPQRIECAGTAILIDVIQQIVSADPEYAAELLEKYSGMIPAEW